MRTVALLLLLLAGCTSVPKQRELLDNIEGATMTRTQLRARMSIYMVQLTENVARAANQIAAQTDDREVARRALIWKINAVGVVQVTATHTDPAAAMFATWAFVAGMRAFFDDGAGRELFGDQQPLAVAASARLEDDIVQIAEMLSTEAKAGVAREMVMSHAEEHPFEDLHFTSWRSDNSLISMLEETELDVFSVAASLEDRVAHMAEVMRFYTYMLPNQARWHAELLTGDILEREELKGVTSDIATMANDLRGIGEFVSEANDLVTAQREAAMAEMVDALDRQRIELTESIDQQRVEAFAAIAEERKLILAFVDDLVESENRLVPEIVEPAVDHFWWRGIQVIAGLVVVGGVLALGLIKLRIGR